MGLLDDAGPWLAQQMQAATDASGTIFYARGGQRIDLTGKAWIGRLPASRLPKDPGAGAVVSRGRDYMIPVADLALDGERWAPEKGDRIEHTLEGRTRTFDVLPEENQPHVMPADHEGIWLRVHTQEQC